MTVLHSDDVSYKPCKTAPKSEHIIIRGVGDRIGDTEQLVRDTLQQFGVVRNLEMPIKKAHLFVTMDSIESCEKIRDAISSVPEWANRKLIVHYCKLRCDAFDGLPNICTDFHPDGVIPGFKFVANYIDQQQEADLIEFVSQIPNWSKLDLRLVSHFGYAFDYSNNEIDLHYRCEPIPKMFKAISERMYREGLTPFDSDQMTINRYDPGAGIPPHCDRHSSFLDGVASLSLQGDSVITFIDLDNESRKVNVYLPRRCLFVMTGESRYRWKHTIRARQYDRVDGEIRPRTGRISLTYRAVNPRKQCECNYPEHCDRSRPSQPDAIFRPECDPEAIYKSPQVEIEYVHGFYDKIADHFSSTRYKPWPLVEKFIKGLPPFSFIADIGCGNGKYLSCVNPASYIVGFDRCEGLVHHCKERLPSCEVGVCDALYVPIRSASVDAALSIAVLHHISNVPRRLLLLSELVRIVRPGGMILVVAWAMEQDHSSRRRFTDRDCFVPWQKTSRFLKDGDEPIVQRFCHMYAQGEIPDLVKEIDGAEVVSEVYDASNWLVTIRKRVI